MRAWYPSQLQLLVLQQREQCLEVGLALLVFVLYFLAYTSNHVLDDIESCLFALFSLLSLRLNGVDTCAHFRVNLRKESLIGSTSCVHLYVDEFLQLGQVVFETALELLDGFVSLP